MFAKPYLYGFYFKYHFDPTYLFCDSVVTVIYSRASGHCICAI